MRPGRAAAGAAIAFLAALLAGPLLQGHFLERMPGDLVDARFNNYLLENAFRAVTGQGNSLWHPDFYSPFPYLIGFSENLFGSVPVYAVFRLLTSEPDTAFQLWHLAGYAANFAAAYWILRRLGRSALAGCAGALIFAFALPVSAHLGHAQLHYRFGVPLSAGMLVLFLEGKDPRHLLAAAGWLVWQFCCGIYTGFFTLLLLACAALAHAAGRLASGGGAWRRELHGFLAGWRAVPAVERRRLALALVALVAVTALLFYPYLYAVTFYGAQRPPDEIAAMLPRPQSYLIADTSWLWSGLSRQLGDLPMRHEHQMFVGLLPLLLAAAGVWIGRRERPAGYAALAAGLAIVVLLTLSVAGISLWLVLAHLPPASAIRAVTRIDLVLLFPLGYLAAVAVDRLRRPGILPAVLVVAALVAEAVAVSPAWSDKQEWRDRVRQQLARVPTALPPDAVLFFAQDGPEAQSELDAMWAALALGVPTLNGYSGFQPRGYRQVFGRDCDELPLRVAAYRVLFALQGRTGDLAVVPIGFSGCAWQGGG